MHMKRLGPYELGPLLGKGGMGSVYRGSNIETGEPAAIKALAPQLATAEGFRERFEAEIESLRTLRHDGIVRLFGYGEESGTLFYAMELVNGRSLEEELKAGRRFTWREVVDIAIQVCKALKHAHDHGIVHRDIKPANILLDEKERVKLADFGIARLFGSTQLTMAGGVLGTADYMSPEQATGIPVNERCDQYSLGCVMYALLAGRPPFQAKSLPEMLQLQRFAEPEPVRRYARRAPEQLDSVIGQLLSKDPDDRFPNTLVLARHLEAMRRALSRPFDPTAPMPGDPPSGTSEGQNGEHSGQLPLELAETKAAEQAAGVEGRESDDFTVSESIALGDSAAAMREAATIDSSAMHESGRTTESTTFGQGHFTTVDRTTPGRASHSITPSLIASAVALVALVVAIGWGIYQISRPYDADGLYALIRSGPSEPTLEELRPHAGRIEEFLARFPEDPRAEELRGYAQALELDRLERRFTAMARVRRGNEELLTAERIYLEAIQISDTQPALAAGQLNNLLTLFEGVEQTDSGEDSELDVQRRLLACLELARRQLERLEDRLAAQIETDRQVLQSRLQEARAMRDVDPERAIAMCRSLVDLYADQPWAQQLVAEAQQLLDEWQRTTDN